ncbi:MAG: hypothetical protein K0Q55_1120 [Verrucomicrobia bacterium]|jgi:hypothetical protein|nr:hypothetical protein [Verrucomicrobiota bacterium]
MADEYQRGTDEQWLEHSNQELSVIVKKRERTIGLLKYLLVILIVALGWTVFKFSRHAPIRELWSFNNEVKK